MIFYTDLGTRAIKDFLASNVQVNCALVACMNAFVHQDYFFLRETFEELCNVGDLCSGSSLCHFEPFKRDNHGTKKKSIPSIFKPYFLLNYCH